MGQEVAHRGATDVFLHSTCRPIAPQRTHALIPNTRAAAGGGPGSELGRSLGRPKTTTIGTIPRLIAHWGRTFDDRGMHGGGGYCRV